MNFLLKFFWLFTMIEFNFLFGGLIFGGIFILSKVTFSPPHPNLDIQNKAKLRLVIVIFVN